MSNSSYLNDLAKNNDPPSDKALLEARELISGPLKQKEDINAELARLDDIIEKLLDRRVEIDESMSAYERILSPIRRVPNDILHTIFWHCLPTDHHPHMGASNSPMILTRVCSTWRAVALSSPRLWAQLYITFQKEREIYSSYPGQSIPLEKVIYVLQLRCQAVMEWLSRSGDCPLSIMFHLHQSPIMKIDAEPMDETTKLCLEIILSFSPRLKNLEVVLPSEVYHELENMVSSKTFPMLEQLGLTVSHGDGETPPHSRQPLSLLNSPQLKHLSARLTRSGNETPWWALPTARLVPWYHITHLAERSYRSIQDFLSLLKCCPQIVDLEFFIADDMQGDNINIREDVFLPCLLSLSIRESLGRLPVYAIYDCIYAPQLLRLRYHLESYRHNNAAPSMVPLIARATNLKELYIDRDSLSPQIMLEFLQSASKNSLTRLVLDWRVQYGLDNRQDPFDLNVLIIDVDDLDVTSRKTVLLPRLEELELYTARATDETVLKFITSRMDPASNIAVLRKVVIDFCRRFDDEAELNIHEEIRKRVDMNNVEISLDFRHLKPSVDDAYSEDPLSPSYNLHHHSGPGWEYNCN